MATSDRDFINSNDCVATVLRYYKYNDGNISIYKRNNGKKGDPYK